jgi:hypothetical protein
VVKTVLESILTFDFTKSTKLFTEDSAVLLIPDGLPAKEFVVDADTATTGDTCDSILATVGAAIGIEMVALD